MVLRRGAEGTEWNKLKWELVMDLVQMVFRDRVLMEEATWQAVVFLPKGCGDYHGIGIEELVLKALTVILNFSFAASITYHDTLHGFWSGRGMGTASLEVKLLQKVMATREDFYT